MAFSLGLLGCKGHVFKGKSSTEKSKQNADSSAVIKDASSNKDESIALEPTAIDGAFLACFVDRQIAVDIIPGNGSMADQIPIGCRLFEEPALTGTKLRIKESDLLGISAEHRAHQGAASILIVSDF